MDPVDFRALFPALTRLRWFATPGYSPAAAPVADALRAFANEWESGDVDWMRWEHDADDTRRLFGALVGAAPNSIALVQSLAEAASTVAQAVFPHMRSGRVVLAGREFRSNLMPWIASATAKHEVHFVSEERDCEWTELLLKALTDDSVFLALSDVQSATGARASIPSIMARAREVGATVFLNLTQSAGIIDIDLEAIGVDFAACHGYKWLLAPRGAAWLYVRRDHLQQMRPLSPNWKNATQPYADMYGPPAFLSEDARRCDCSLAWGVWSGAGAALRLMLQLPRPTVERHCVEMAGVLRSNLRELGFDVIDNREPSHIVAARSRDPETMANRLRASNVVATVRGGLLRFGCHYFNSEDDVREATECLRPVAATAPSRGRPETP